MLSPTVGVGEPLRGNDFGSALLGVGFWFYSLAHFLVIVFQAADQYEEPLFLLPCLSCHDRLYPHSSFIFKLLLARYLLTASYEKFN